MKPKTTRWLHISDLHIGCPGREVWWQVRSEFRESIRQHFRPIDLILITGDLTFSAQPEQFDLFDIFLGELLGWLKQAGQSEDPLIIPVPGNHDLVWPPKGKLRNFRMLDDFWNRLDEEDIAYFRDELWRDLNASFFKPLFRNYTSWLERSILPRIRDREGVTVHQSHFPGDLSVFVDVPDPPLTVVGLNSAWVQYTKGNFLGSVGLFSEQLVFALGDSKSASPLDILDGRQNLLLMHHPPTVPDSYQPAWFSRESSRRFNEEIYSPDRFLLCLHGHMHQGRSVAFSWSGGKFRYFFQAPSLFGMERYGSSNETRAMGYAWGSVDASGTVRVWPFKRDRQSGTQIFMWDTEFPPDPEGHRLRPLTDVSTAAVATVDTVPWLEALLDRTAYIEISGIGSGSGRAVVAHSSPLAYRTYRERPLSAGVRRAGLFTITPASGPTETLDARHEL